jgi:thioredoxin 1
MKGANMLVRVIFACLIGASFGAALGYFGKCTTGTCPLTANPLRGAFFGALLGFLFVSLLTDYSIGKEGKEKNTMVINIGNKETFEKVKNSKGLLLVDFYAEWCHPCKLLSPILEKIAEKYQGKAAFYKVDVTQFGDLAGENGVEATPTVLVFKDGKEVERLVGLRLEADYSKTIDKLSENSGGEQ